MAPIGEGDDRAVREARRVPLSHFAAEMKGEDVGSLPPFELSEGLTMLGAVSLRIEAGKTQEIRRVS